MPLLVIHPLECSLTPWGRWSADTLKDGKDTWNVKPIVDLGSAMLAQLVRHLILSERPLSIDRLADCKSALLFRVGTHRSSNAIVIQDP